MGAAYRMVMRPLYEEDSDPYLEPLSRPSLGRAPRVARLRLEVFFHCTMLHGEGTYQVLACTISSCQHFVDHRHSRFYAGGHPTIVSNLKAFYPLRWQILTLARVSDRPPNQFQSHHVCNYDTNWQWRITQIFLEFHVAVRGLQKRSKKNAQNTLKCNLKAG